MPDYSKQIVYLSQAQYQELITNGTITVDGVTVTYNENDIYVTPQAEPVTDVRVNGTSVVSSGVANMPMASTSTHGVVKVASNYGTGMYVAGGNILFIVPANAAGIKAGRLHYNPVNPEFQHESVFYGLAKAAGHDEKDSTESLGTYTPEAKGAIQSMLGVSSLIAPSEPTLVASKAYAVGDVFTANGKLYKVTTAIAAAETIVVQDEGETVSEHNAEETSLSDGFVKKTDYADYGKPGIVSTQGTYGTRMYEGHKLGIAPTDHGGYKEGYLPYVAVTVGGQHEATFYGLAKAAGDTTQSASSNAVGNYTDSAKAAIKSMLGIVDGSTGTVDVTGTTPTITAVENTRYVCGEVATLTITPPASGICIIRFTSGTTATVLTATGVVWPEWFDATALEASRVYEICITDGYGAVMSWAL